MRRDLDPGVLDDQLRGVLMRYAAKRDATEAAIVDALETFGCVVVALSQKGIPDLLVRTPDDRTHVVECKAPRGTRTPAQLTFIKKWGPVPLLRSPEEAVKWVIGSCRRTAAPP